MTEQADNRIVGESQDTGGLALCDDPSFITSKPVEGPSLIRHLLQDQQQLTADYVFPNYASDQLGNTELGQPAQDRTTTLTHTRWEQPRRLQRQLLRLPTDAADQIVLPPHQDHHLL